MNLFSYCNSSAVPGTSSIAVEYRNTSRFNLPSSNLIVVMNDFNFSSLSLNSFSSVGVKGCSSIFVVGSFAILYSVKFC